MSGIPPKTLAALREWKLQCPKRDSGRKDAQGNAIGEWHLVFPNGVGNVESLSNILQRGLAPTLIAAGVTKRAVDEKGQPIDAPKYGGLHAFRHYFASWCINREVDGGRELPAKNVQELLGHSSIQMTLDRYSHLFKRGDDSGELAMAESAVLR